MSYIDVADMVNWMEEEMNTFQTSRYVRFEHISALIADWRKRGEALERIERWFGEFQPSGRFWDEPENTRKMSYGTCNESNGERDYIRSVARAALTPPPQPEEATPSSLPATDS